MGRFFLMDSKKVEAEPIHFSDENKDYHNFVEKYLTQILDIKNPDKLAVVHEFNKKNCPYVL